MALREDRITGRIRNLLHVPTASILPDGLTKIGVFALLLHYCTTGVCNVSLHQDQRIRCRARVPLDDYNEQDLGDMDW